jgi:hypothetical protein
MSTSRLLVNKSKLWMILTVAMMLFTSRMAYGSILFISYDDPIGDFQNFNIDLTGMTLFFDNATGDYELTVNFDDANPFVGAFNVNANLLNGDISPLTTDPAFVNINEIPTAGAPTTELVFTGTNTNLTSWNQGALIANNSSIFGIPIDAPFSAFGSGVQNRGLGIDELNPATSIVAPIPIPPVLWLFGSGLIGLIGVARRKKS